MTAKELAYADFKNGDAINEFREFLANANARAVLEFIQHSVNPAAREDARAQLDYLLAEKAENTAKITKNYTIILFLVGIFQLALMFYEIFLRVH